MTGIRLGLLVLAILVAGTFEVLAASGSVSYTYDSLGRLVQVTYDNGTIITYSYDAAGNRTVRTSIVQ